MLVARNGSPTGLLLARAILVAFHLFALAPQMMDFSSGFYF